MGQVVIVNRIIEGFEHVSPECSTNMATHRLYRLSVNEICSPLKTFQSSREFVISIRDAMEAHDRAYFDAHILHSNISMANIVTTASGRGFLVDWELSTTNQSFRPMGTWQFMSAAMLRDPERNQTIEDDRESAVNVLTWLALRYTKHDKLHNLRSYLAIYDESDHCDEIGIATGGLNKGNYFIGAAFPTFSSGPLNRLLTIVRKHFSTRYGDGYTTDEVQEAMDFMASGTPMDPSNAHLGTIYLYGLHMEALKTPNWLVETFNKHLMLDDWPFDDKGILH